MTIHLIFTGGRAFRHKNFFPHLDIIKTHFNEDIFVHVGCARGFDKIVREWAAVNNIPHRIYTADWDKYKKPAGVIRNRVMVVSALKEKYTGIYGVAVPGGVGTDDCKKYMRENGIKVYLIGHTHDD